MTKRTLALAAFLVTLVAGSSGCRQADPQEASRASTAVREVTLDVQGMHCATCPVTVRTAAARVPGVLEVRVEVSAAKAWVTYDGAATDPATIAAAITASGYPATVAP